MIRIIALTAAGKLLAEKISASLTEPFEFSYKPKPFTKFVQQAFQQGDRLIMICATGIAVRTLAPVLIDKYNDPAVLVHDEQGQCIIP